MAGYREEEDPFEEDIVFDQTGLLNSTSKMNTAIRRVSSGKCALFAKTLGLCGAFFGLGLCIAIPGPTFLSPVMELEGQSSPISNSYIARTSGYIVGSIIGGALFDRFNRLFLLFLSLLLTAILITVTPWCQVMWLLETCVTILGITLGFLDTGGNVLCLDLWGRNSGPFMQALHFSFGLGAFVAPLLAAPFLEPAFVNSTLTTEFSHAITEFPVHLEDRFFHDTRLRRDLEGFSSVLNTSVANNIKTFQESTLFSEAPNSLLAAPTNPNIVFNDSNISVTSDIHSTSPPTVEFIDSMTSTSPKPKVLKKKPNTNGSKLEKTDWDKFHVGKPPAADLMPISTTVVSTSAEVHTVPPVTSPVTEGSITVTGSTSAASLLTSISPPSIVSGANVDEIPTTLTSGSISSSSDYTSTYSSPTTVGSNERKSSTLLMAETSSTVIPVISSVTTGEPLSISTLLTSAATEAISDVKNYDSRNPNDKSAEHLTSTTSEQREDPRMDININRKNIRDQLNNDFEMTTKANLLMEESVSAQSSTVYANDPILKNKAVESTTPLHNPSLWNQNTNTDLGINVKVNPLSSTNSEKFNAVKYEHSGGVNKISNLDDIGKEAEQKINPTPEASVTQSINFISSVIPKHVHHKPGTFDNDTEHINTILDMFANRIEKYGFSKIQFTYLIVGIFVFIISLIFLGFLCHNPRDPKSKQEGQGGKKITNKVVHKLLIALMALFFFLYMGLEVTYGQLVLTFTIHSNLQLPQSTGSGMSVLFWGSFAAMRFASIFFAIGFDPVTMLLLNFAFCTSGTILLAALANHIETALWVGTALIGIGLASMFPTGILWIERYIHVSNKVAAIFVIGVALGEMVCPVTIYQLMVIEPMFLMHAALVINIMCILTFIMLWWLASRHGEKYSVISNNGYQLASQHDEEEDMIDMSPSGSSVMLRRQSFSSEHRALLNGSIHRGP